MSQHNAGGANGNVQGAQEQLPLGPITSGQLPLGPITFGQLPPEAEPSQLPPKAEPSQLPPGPHPPGQMPPGPIPPGAKPGQHVDFSAAGSRAPNQPSHGEGAPFSYVEENGKAPPNLPNNPTMGESFITGSEVPAPSQAFSVTDYPYLTPGSVDMSALIYLLVAILTGVAMAVWRRKKQQTRLTRCARWLHTHRLATVLLFFIGLEITLHTTSALSSQRMYRPSPIGFWKLTPNFGAGNEMTNSLGLADEEFSLKKPAGTRRIICLGDSTTMGGAGASPYETYSKALQYLLRNTYGETSWEVINAGVSGYTTYQGLYLLRKVGLKYNPDILVIAYGYHDGMLDWAEDKFHMTDNRILVVIRGLLYKSQTYLIVRKQILNIETVHHKVSQNAPSFHRVAPDDYRNNLEFYIKIAKMNGMKILFLNMPYSPYYDQRMAPSKKHRHIYRQTLKKYSTDPEVGFIDVYKMWINQPRDQLKKLIFDHSHPTVYGHRKIAEMMLNYITPRWIGNDSGRENGDI